MNRLIQSLNAERTAVIQQVQQSVVQLTDGRRGIGAGTIWQADGLVLTNAHVVQGRTVQVTLADGRTTTAKLLASDKQADLAALQLPLTDLPTIAFGDSRRLRPGQLVTAVGHPWGVVGAASAGMVIDVGVPLEWNGSQREMVQVGIQLRPGHSGGPMVDENGRLIGINTLISGPLVGMAIPIHVALDFVQNSVGQTLVRTL